MDAELREAPRIERTQDPGAPAPSPMATASHEHSPAPLIPLSPDLVSQSIGATTRGDAPEASGRDHLDAFPPGPVTQEVIEGKELAQGDSVERRRTLMNGEQGADPRGVAEPVRSLGHVEGTKSQALPGSRVEAGQGEHSVRLREPAAGVIQQACDILPGGGLARSVRGRKHLAIDPREVPTSPEGPRLGVEQAARYTAACIALSGRLFEHEPRFRPQSRPHSPGHRPSGLR